jgi:CRP/FNR family transcriptional regulator, cyclic AMP receptor protein
MRPSNSSLAGIGTHYLGGTHHHLCRVRHSGISPAPGPLDGAVILMTVSTITQPFRPDPESRRRPPRAVNWSAGPVAVPPAGEEGLRPKSTEGELISAGDRPGLSPWAARNGRERPSSNRYLLDLDVELAEELDVRMRLVARPAATAVVCDVDVGEMQLTVWLAEAASGPGVLLLDGVLAANVTVGDRVASELLGPGDLVEPTIDVGHELLACDVGWRALAPVRFAVLDAAFAERVRPWPQIMQALLRRAERRTRNLNVQRAIACQPRLEVRLALLLWHLAARWGRVEPGGIRLPLPLTHQLLGRLVGAERPSVSHALARLARAGFVTGHGDEWHLHGNVEDQLSSMVDPGGGRVEQLVAAVGSRARQR